MRSALILVLALLFCGQSQAEEIIASVSSSRSDLTFERLNGYDVVRMADCDMTREVGEPQLPVKLVHMAVPPGMKVDGFRILAVDREEVEGAYDLFPVQPPQILGMPGKVVQTLDFAGPKKDVYGSDSPYPEDIVELSAMGSFRGHRLASLLVHPLQYIPAQRKLLLYTRIEFGVSFIPDGDAPRMLRRRSERREDVCRPFVERLVLNPQDVGEPYALSNLQESPLPEGDYEYVIVTDPEYEPIFRPLADWKTRKGVAATIVTTSWIYRQYTGVDAQEQIRNFIRDAYQNWGAVWVLIGGDTDIVPVRLAWAMDCQMDPADNDLPCDLYYSDLDGTWDTNGNGIYGQVDDGVDLYPEVFVGRAPVDKPKEAKTFVRKVMEYERGVDTQYQLKMLFAAEILWSDPYTDAGEGKNMIEEECIPSRFAPITKLYHSLGNESVQSVVAAMNQGHHIINHDGHAWYTDMCVGEGCLSTWDIDGLTNGPRQSILYSIGCWPGAIDYDCIGEHFVTNPRGGGVAFIGNSRYGWGSPGNPGYGYSDRFDHRFYQELFQDRISHIGATLAAAKAFYVGRSQQENVYRWHQYQLNLLGDPEMDIWTDLPVALTVDHPAEVPTGPSTFTLTVTSTTTPVEGALACLMNGTDLYHRGTTDSQGRVAFNINPDGVDTVWVTVTAHDHLPYKGFATLFAEGPYVSCWTQTIQDSMGGNGDGLINPGETIGLNVHLKNYGDEDATGVTGILRTDDPLVNVLDSLFAFGSIPSGQISAVTIYDSDCYTLEVSPQAENSHTVHFTLEISDSLGNVWTDIIPITVAAPLLICERYSIDDSTGGDGDGLIELGETVWLEVEIENRGLGIAYGVTLHPQTESCDVAILDSLVNLGDIPPDSTVARSFSIELFPAACPSPPMDTYTLTMATSDGFPFTDGFSLAREQALWEFSDDMESGDTLWTHSGQGDLWHLTQHRSHSGDFSWYCGSEGQWRYDKFMDCSLVSSPITLGPRAHLSFWHWYEVATYGVNGILVEIDDGSGWRKLDFIGSGGALQPLLPVGNDWLEDTYDLAEYPAGSQVQIRFRFVSDGERVSEGVYIDDVRVFSDYSTPFPLLDLV
ncbi:MAG: C25 family cysteine peptidase, partial [bacterium]